MEKNYTANYPYCLEDIKEICNEELQLILMDMFSLAFCDYPISDIQVRYVLEEGTFGYAYMGDFFFIDDCMYVFSDDDAFKKLHNDSIPELVKDLFDFKIQRDEKYVCRVIFAGVRTPYKDNLGDWIYTGDIVKVNDYLISGICAFPFMQEYAQPNQPAIYGLMLDNHMFKLSDCTKVERLGTIYSFIDPTTTEIDIENVVGGLAQYGGFTEDYLYCANYTPSFQQEFWKYRGLEILGIEYTWRK